MKIKLLIFDFDDTLVNIGKYVNWIEAKNQTINFLNDIGINQMIVDDTILDNKNYVKGLMNYQKQVQNTIKKIDLVNYHALGVLDLLYISYNHIKKLDETKAVSFYQEATKILDNFELIGAKKSTLIDGSISLLKWVKNQNIMVGIATNNSYESVSYSLKKLNIKKYVDSIHARHIPIYWKPDSFPLNSCLSDLKIKNNEAVMIGDSWRDMSAAKKLNLMGIGIYNDNQFNSSDTQTLIDNGASHVISNLKNLPDILSKYDNSLKT